ncbi:MAG: phospho-sugar mutase [Myxococcota bacterium]
MIEQIEHWLADPAYAEDRAALGALVTKASDGDDAATRELADAFSRPLPIGTGGRRGACGPGPNRVNGAVMRQTAVGLLDAMSDAAAWGAGDGPHTVAIAYDTRASSRRFAHVVARQLVGGGARVVLLDAPRPTPQLSFMVRQRRCAAGVVISASHNPPGDNGIKLYGPDGAQVVAARDKRLFAAIEAAATGDLARIVPGEGAEAWLAEGSDPAVTVIAGEAALADADAPYHAFVRAQGVASGPGWGDGLTVVYTPLHGVGHTAVAPVLADSGVALHLVERQCDPDGGRFSTVTSANPEVPESMDMGRALAQEVGAQLVIASDPDADRMGALARVADGSFVALDGNRLAVLMADHVLRHEAAREGAPRWMLQTLVSSPLVAKLARAHGVEVVDDLLTGFKHHAAMMAEQPDKTVAFMFEEAHGYMRGDDVHDKDGAVAALLMAECAALAHRAGRTLMDELRRIWRTHGYHRERTENIWAYGATGRKAIAAAVQAYRSDPPTTLGGLEVRERVDRAEPRHTDSPTRNLTSNVLVFELGADDGRACTLVVRPSGTEPKAKIYALASGAPVEAEAALDAQVTAVDATVTAVLADARARAEAVMAPFSAGA